MDVQGRGKEVKGMRKLEGRRGGAVRIESRCTARERGSGREGRNLRTSKTVTVQL